MAKLTASAPQIVVGDVVKTAEYYRDKLGFQIIGYFLDPPVYAMVERDGLQFHFGKADGSEVQVTNSPLRKVGFDFYLWTNDVDALYEEFTLKDIVIVEKPVDRVYGNREFRILDINGLNIVFGQI